MTNSIVGGPEKVDVAEVGFGVDLEDSDCTLVEMAKGSVPAVMKIRIGVSVPSGSGATLFFPRSGGN